MKLSISNIAWNSQDDEEMYLLMKKNGYIGLEIAPTRIINEHPYEKMTIAKKWASDINSKYGLIISSMQSIWFGRSEKIFGSEDEKRKLIEYTKKAILFAESIGCGNLVFGCPKNRVMGEGSTSNEAIPFFEEIANYARNHNTCIAMEANPTIYNTNFVNTTQEALELVERVNSPGFKLNLDLGTVIYNSENLDVLIGHIKKINHVHISEPMLVLIKKRELHKKIKEILYNEGYSKFVSIEMASGHSINEINETMLYIYELFGEY